jgi:aminotransferase in exopolysaccharide biosynthesis
MFDNFISYMRDLYSTKKSIPLHAPKFNGNEKKYILSAIDSTFVSSVGEFVDRFENAIAEYTGSKYAIATNNGTSALHIALKLSGVEDNSEVITQPLTFVATCNAIRYCNAEPIFVDVDKKNLGLSSRSLELFLQDYAEIRDDGHCWNKKSNKKITACLPMHTFGLPADIDSIKVICDKYNIALVEDTAESLGSNYKGKHTGTIGKMAAISFNGNKIITTGGGGMILTNNEELAFRAKHITTTAKISNKWFYEHDEVGYNYRLPNINAALGLAQTELLSYYVERKRWLAKQYQEWGRSNGFNFVKESLDSRSNYWLNTIVTNNQNERDILLQETNDNGIMTRPVWTPMHQLPIYSKCQRAELPNTEWLFNRLVNVPSGIIKN